MESVLGTGVFNSDGDCFFEFPLNSTLTLLILKVKCGSTFIPYSNARTFTIEVYMKVSSFNNSSYVYERKNQSFRVI